MTDRATGLSRPELAVLFDAMFPQAAEPAEGEAPAWSPSLWHLMVAMLSIAFGLERVPGGDAGCYDRARARVRQAWVDAGEEEAQVDALLADIDAALRAAPPPDPTGTDPDTYRGWYALLEAEVADVLRRFKA